MALIGSGVKGSATTNKGMMGSRLPHLIIRRKANYNPTDLSAISGLPSNSLYKLKNCSGFTRVKEIHLHNVPATDSELDELESLLKQGVHI